jgi:hypothetical protein
MSTKFAIKTEDGLVEIAHQYGGRDGWVITWLTPLWKFISDATPIVAVDNGTDIKLVGQLKYRYFKTKSRTFVEALKLMADGHSMTCNLFPEYIEIYFDADTDTLIGVDGVGHTEHIVVTTNLVDSKWMIAEA